MNNEIKLELDKIKSICEKVPFYKNKYLEEKDIIFILNKFMPFTTDLSLPQKLKSDLLGNPMYTAIATWCDTKDGVCVEFPKQILHVSKQFVPDDSILDETA